MFEGVLLKSLDYLLLAWVLFVVIAAYFTQDLTRAVIELVGFIGVVYLLWLRAAKSRGDKLS
ncbi:hypothetical protein GCM10007894_29320 [Paraferrimonas haliotis]|uniref:Uncharacterized protein n=1 Tax=Paraferrimonas haliotis TaxID=2013866 RepID=A0AA37TZ76_9GAMM|nr:hypothetical protein GCM10007894_29320 [Paraferrimonas haliotis]